MPAGLFPNSAKKLTTKQECRDEKQVMLDINRMQLTKAAAERLKMRIRTVLNTNPELHYYQGFHDIAQHTKSTKQLECLALKHMRDFMTTTFTPTLQILKLLPELIIAADPDNLGLLLIESDPEGVKTKGFFALPSIITLFSHNCADMQVIEFLIDKVINYGFSYMIYFYAASCILYSDQIYRQLEENCADEQVHMALQTVGELVKSEDLEILDDKVKEMKRKFPLKSLKSFEYISEYSVLKAGGMRKKSTIKYTINQLERNPTNDPKFKFTPVMAMSIAVGALAVGMVYTKFRKN